MAAAPAYAATPRFGGASISSADTSRTSPSGTSVFAAGSNGSRIDLVHINATGTTTAGTVRLWIYTGSTYYLLKEVTVDPVTPSASVPAWAADITFDQEDGPVTAIDGGIVLPSGHSLRATTHNAEAFVVLAFGGDF